MTQWKNYLDLFNRGASRGELLKAARAMEDPHNRRVALNNLGITTAKERREIAGRWQSIQSVTDEECRRHCQFSGLPLMA